MLEGRRRLALDLDGAPLAGDFSLTGDATLSWTGTAPTRSNLSFQIKGLVTPVPEPASLALLGMGLPGLGFAARRRRG